MWPKAWKLGQLPQHHRVAEMDIGRGRVDASFTRNGLFSARAFVN